MACKTCYRKFLCRLQFYHLSFQQDNHAQYILMAANRLTRFSINSIKKRSVWIQNVIKVITHLDVTRLRTLASIICTLCDLRQIFSRFGNSNNLFSKNVHWWYKLLSWGWVHVWFICQELCYLIHSFSNFLFIKELHEKKFRFST